MFRDISFPAPVRTAIMRLGLILCCFFFRLHFVRR